MTLIGLALFLGGALLFFAELVSESPASGPFTLAQLLAPLLCCGVAYYLNDVYDLAISARETTRRLLRALVLSAVLLTILYTILPSLGVMRSMPASVFFVLAVVSVTSASVHHGVRAFLGTREHERILILGTGPLALKVSQALHATARIRPFSVRFLHDEPAVSGTLANMAHGSIRDLAESFKSYAPRRIVAALSEGTHLPTRELLAFRARGGIVESGIQAYERITGKLAIESVTPRDIVFSGAFRLSPWKLWLKRLSSIIIALIGLLLAAPLFPFIALAIRLTSRGPIFFAQERAGLHGQPFRLYKFRTMEVTAGPHSEWERDNADRITPLGHWLRKLRLDELPQFWNILRGDMNIVGPRPHPISNYELFATAIPYYSLRSLIPPGLTGWAQIRWGYVHDLPGEVEKMRYDLYYIAHLSLWLDLKILFETARVVIFQALEDDLPQPSEGDMNEVSAESGHEDAVRERQYLAGIEFGGAGIAASTDGRSEGDAG